MGINFNGNIYGHFVDILCVEGSGSGCFAGCTRAVPYSLAPWITDTFFAYFLFNGHSRDKSNNICVHTKNRIAAPIHDVTWPMCMVNGVTRVSEWMDANGVLLVNCGGIVHHIQAQPRTSLLITTNCYYFVAFITGNIIYLRAHFDFAIIASKKRTIKIRNIPFSPPTHSSCPI